MLRYEDIARSITARHLATPLADATTAAPNERGSTALRRLQPHAFDQAPVMLADELLGWVATTRLKANPTYSVRRSMQRLGPASYVSADAPVRTVVEALAGSGMVFVVTGREVDGFVVAADINKHAARTHFYLLVADLELALVALLRRSYVHVAILLNRLSSKDRSDAKKRFDRDRELGSDVDQLAVLDFQDLLTIVGRSPRVRRVFECRSEDDWSRLSEGMNRFRVAVMHPSSPFIGQWSIPNVLEMETRLRHMLAHAWGALHGPV